MKKLKELEKIYKYYDKEVNDIRDKITMGDISYYKGLLLMKKLLLIVMIYQEITRHINKMNNHEKILKNYYLISTLLLALIGFIFKNFGIVIVLGLLKLPLDSKVFNKLNESRIALSELSIKYNESVEKVNNTNYLLAKKLNNKIPEEEIIEEKEALISVFLSNIENDEVIYNIPEDLKEEVIYILQQDLGVDITDYQEIIKVAQERINDQTIKRELKIN